METTFVAIDVETASSRVGSICQIGIALFEKGELTSVRSTLIRPEVSFTAHHTRLHGIDPDHVQHAPVWAEAYPEIARVLHGRIIASHTVFDRRQIFAACCWANRAMFSYQQWIDTCAVARKAWPKLPAHSLPALARHLGISYRAHCAAEDARVAGMVLLHAWQTCRSK